MKLTDMTDLRDALIDALRQGERTACRERLWKENPLVAAYVAVRVYRRLADENDSESWLRLLEIGVEAGRDTSSS